MGAVSTVNSLVGTTASDEVGYGVTALTNGNYVVDSPYWNNGSATEAGAATWENGGCRYDRCRVHRQQPRRNDRQRPDWHLHHGALAKGNYVVGSQLWHNGRAASAGAVTWGNGATGTTGVVSAANSLVGTTTDDYFGDAPVVPLTNGNYVVGSRSWNNGSAASAGAVTLGERGNRHDRESCPPPTAPRRIDRKRLVLAASLYP